MTGNKINGNGNGAGGRGKEMPKIAIVGMAAMFPGEGGTTGFWRTITRGEDTIGEVPSHYWRSEDYYDPDPAAPDKTYCNRGGFIDKVAFDTLKFGVPPSVMKATDTAQLLALMTASEVLDGVQKSQATPIDKSRTGVVLGVASSTELCVHMGSRLQRPIWANALREHGMSEEEVTAICDRISDHFVPWQEASFPGLLGNVVAGRIANRLDLGGANFVIDAACASSLSALQVGLSQLYLGEADMVRRRRRRRAQRHPDVHVLLEDAGPLAERRLPALLRPGRRHDARRGRGDVRAPPARGRRARRQRDLRRDPRPRRRLRRPGDQRLRAARPRARRWRVASRLRRGGLRPRDRRAGGGPRHRHQGRRRRRVRRASAWSSGRTTTRAASRSHSAR